MYDEKQYGLQLYSGYIESCSIASITLWRLFEMKSEVSSTEVLKDFRESMKTILPQVNEDRAYWGAKPLTAGEVFLDMMKSDNDQVGSVYELLEGEGWYFSPANEYIGGMITVDRVENYLDHEDPEWLPYVDVYGPPKHEIKPSPLTEEEKALLNELPEDDQ